MSNYTLGGLLSGALNLEPYQPLCRNEIDGLTISTVFAGDIDQYETAIIDKNGAHPVERYETRDEATSGHSKWLTNSTELKTIIKLGYGELIEDEEITLERQ